MKTKLLCVAVVILLAAGTVLAQSDLASITGTVTDTSGAVVPGASISAINIQTNSAMNTTTNELGIFRVLNLPIGEYKVVVSKQGFGSYERKGVYLQIKQVAELNVQLKVGAAAETVTVSEDVSLLNTETSSISTNLRNNDVNELPLNVQGGRNLSNFMFAYVPGVEGDDYTSHIAGSMGKTKEVMIDGTSAVAQIGGYISESSPPMEAVEEFQVSSTGLRADEGRSGGGVFRYNMKSGTNSWHGSGVFFMHNERFNATDWTKKYNIGQCLSNVGNVTSEIDSCHRQFDKPADRLYDYGASFGGAIIKDKLFFNAAWERYTFANYGLGGLGSTVPTTAFLNGDFSALLQTGTILGTDGAGQTVYKGAIVDPATGNVFPGNIIPQNRVSPISQKIIALYKQYYTPVGNSLYSNNAMPANNPATWYQSNQGSIKIDYNINDRHHLNGSYIIAFIPRLLSDQGGIWSPGSTDGGPMANAYDHDTKAHSIRLSETWNISNTMVNVANITFNRFYNPSHARSQQGNWSQTLGLGDFGAGNFPIIKFQGVNGDQHTRLASGQSIDESQLGSQFNDFYAANTFIYGDALSWVRGRHTFRFGGDLRVMQFNTHGDYGVPTYVFDPAQTAGSYGSGNAGFGFASFMLGAANQASVSTFNWTYGRRKAFSAYAMDDIKVNSKLTLNVDVRWDFNGRYHEKNGRWSNFNTELINPVTGKPGALEFAKDGSDSFERNQYYTNFSGHIGGAYQITPNTVARAAFGVFYVPLNLNTWGAIPYGFNPGFAAVDEYKQPFTWDNGYPGTPVVTNDPNYVKWGMVSIDPRSLMLGNVQTWNVGVQRELSRDLVLNVDFVQNHGYHLESGYLRANQPDLANYTANVGNLWNWVPNIPGVGGGFGWMTLAPFPTVASTWGPLFYVGSPDGNSDYQSLQFTVKKRASHGLSLMASYNLSSAHGNTDNAFQELWWAGPLQDVYNLQQERQTIAPFDQTHIVKGYVIYELPFGNGKTFLSSSSSAMNTLVGGWQLSAGFHYNTGTPMRITANTWYPGINNVYSNIDPSCSINQGYDGSVGGTYFNPSCFSNPAYGAFGNAPGYLSKLRNPGLATEDLGITKSLKFGERYNLSIRFQMFNVFNRRGFGGPNTTIGAENFGVPIFGKVGTPDGFGHLYAAGGAPGPRQGQFGMRFTF